MSTPTSSGAPATSVAADAQNWSLNCFWNAANASCLVSV